MQTSPLALCSRLGARFFSGSLACANRIPSSFAAILQAVRRFKRTPNSKGGHWSTMEARANARCGQNQFHLARRLACRSDRPVTHSGRYVGQLASGTPTASQPLAFREPGRLLIMNDIARWSPVGGRRRLTKCEAASWHRVARAFAEQTSEPLGQLASGRAGRSSAKHKM